MRGERARNERIVVIKNLFDPAIFEEKADLIFEYTNDLREECAKCGNVRKVVIYDVGFYITDMFGFDTDNVLYYFFTETFGWCSSNNYV